MPVFKRLMCLESEVVQFIRYVRVIGNLPRRRLLWRMERVETSGLEGLEVEGFATAAAVVNTSTDVAANTTNITYYPYYQHSLYVGASFVLAYFSIFLLCMVGNILVCLIVMENRRMRTVINLFILNLAISDLLVGIFCIPITLVDNLITGERSWSALFPAPAAPFGCQEGQFPPCVTHTLLSAAGERSSSPPYMHRSFFSPDDTHIV